MYIYIKPGEQLFNKQKQNTDQSRYYIFLKYNVNPFNLTQTSKKKIENLKNVNFIAIHSDITQMTETEKENQN